MNARKKLNIGFLNGSLLIAILAGVAFNSWLVFFGVLVVLVAGSLYCGDIRIRGRRR